jgi:transposase
MAQVRVERLDHRGLLAAVIKDVGLMDRIDTRLVPDEQEVITPGEAVAGMMLNGLGVANRPLSFTPQFLANQPLDLLLRDGINAEMCNRFKLGRTLEEAQAYGCNLWCEELALAVCTHAGLDRRFTHLDTTSFRLTGEYIPERDEHAMCITHGSSKDHRPDLQQAVLALMVSQDGGVPWVSKRWDGTTADTQIFQERAAALMRAFKTTPRPRSLVADAQLSCEDTAPQRATLGFLTRIPATLKVVAQVISQALPWDTWQSGAPPTRSQPLALGHSGMVQRWRVGSSQAALERAEATLKNATQHEHAALTKPLLHLHAQRFGTPQAAHAALAVWATDWKDHRVASAPLTEHTRSAGKGRPTPRRPRQASEWHIQAPVHTDEHAREQATQAKACFVLGTHIAARERSDPEGIAAYKGQSHVEIYQSCNLRRIHGLSSGGLGPHQRGGRP